MAKRPAKSDLAIRGALFLVMGSALSVGTWSIYTLLSVRFHAPHAVALFGAVMFDAAALYFALLSQKYATSPDSGLAPRLAMLAMIGMSSWVNWQHAQLEHWGKLGLILAAAPITAELAFEFHHRYIHREALRAQGRVPSALPVLGKWAWLLHPVKAFGVVDRTVEARLQIATGDAERIILGRDAPQQIEAPQHDTPAAAQVALLDHIARALVAASSAASVGQASAPVTDAPSEAADQTRDAPLERSEAQPQQTPVPPQRIAPGAPGDARPNPGLASLSKADAVRAARDALPGASAPEIAQHLAQHGITADAPYIRTVLSRDARKAKPNPTNGGYL